MIAGIIIIGALLVIYLVLLQVQNEVRIEKLENKVSNALSDGDKEVKDILEKIENSHEYLLGEIKKLKPKPEYKIGDWVKLVSKNHQGWSPVMLDKFSGTIQQLTLITDYSIDFKNDRGYLFDLGDIERLATPEEIAEAVKTKEEPKEAPEFKVGDKVRCISIEKGKGETGDWKKEDDIKLGDVLTIRHIDSIGWMNFEGKKLTHAPGITIYNADTTTTNATATTVQSLAMALNSLMFVDAIALYQNADTRLTGGYIWATLGFTRGPSGAPIAMGTIDIINSNNLAGPAVTMVPNASTGGVDIKVAGRISTNIVWSVRTTADRGDS